MSGGSYEYLYCKEVIPDDVSANLGAMIRDMKNQGFNAIASHLEVIDQLLVRADRKFRELSQVMHDWEWYISADISKENFTESQQKFLNNFNGGAPCEIKDLLIAEIELKELMEQVRAKKVEILLKLSNQ